MHLCIYSMYNIIYYPGHQDQIRRYNYIIYRARVKNTGKHVIMSSTLQCKLYTPQTYNILFSFSYTVLYSFDTSILVHRIMRIVPLL